MPWALIEGARIAQLAAEPFPVPEPLTWVEVPEGTTDRDTYENGQVIPADPPPIPEAEATPVVTAMAFLTAENGDITAMQMTAGLGFAMALDINVFWIFFATPEPDANYVPFVQAPGLNADVTARAEDYFEITLTDRTTGEAPSSAQLAVSVQRVR